MGKASSLLVLFLQRIYFCKIIGENTLTAVRMLTLFAQVSWRPSEYFMLQDGILSRPTKYLMLQDEALWRATEYLLQLRKYYDGRQSTSAFCASIVTNDRIPYAAEWSTMTADRVHYSTAEILRRPTEYFRILRKHRDGRQNIQTDYYRLLVKNW